MSDTPRGIDLSELAAIPKAVYVTLLNALDTADDEYGRSEQRQRARAWLKQAMQQATAAEPRGAAGR